ncbi:MAG: restriction endonuclease subunit S [Bacteroidales bacterium]|nr:restriction endonuclease subunit S [Bacteroidales bacterium]
MPTYPTYKLGEIIDKVPIEFKVKQKDYLPKGKFPVVDQGQDLIGGFVDDESLLVKTELPIIVFGDHTKAKKFIDFPFVAGADGTKIIKPKKDFFIEPKLFYWFLHCVKFPDKGYARHFQYLLKSDIAVPPLATQQAIVTRIETLFAELDKAVQHLRTAQQQLKTYRQAVLNHWLNNDDGKWEMVKLGEVAEIKRGRSKHRPRNDKSLFGGKYPFIQTGEIREANGGTITTYTQTYSEKGLEQSRLWPKGTLCLTIAANIAETAYLGFDACFPDSVVGILAQEDKLNLDYFNFFIQLVKQEIENKASATAQKNINVDFLENLNIALPPLTEQQRIVKEIESRLSQATASETYIENALQQAEALRQSILKKAFGGELV